MIGLIIIITLYCALLIYEIGHIIAVKINKLNIKKIVVGFGPKLICINGERTDYILKVIPLGSYTELGDDENIDEDYKSYSEVSCINKIFIIASGIISSFIVMIILESIAASHLNLSNNIMGTLQVGFRNSIDFISNVYKSIYEMAVTRSMNLGMFLNMIISNGRNMMGMGVGFFMYLLARILGIIISINIIPLPIYSGGEAVLEIIKGIFKVNISENELSMFNIITIIASILFLIYIII